MYLTKVKMLNKKQQKGILKGSIDYLAQGASFKKEAHKVLTEYEVMEKLENFQPILVGTIPIGIAIKG